MIRERPRELGGGRRALKFTGHHSLLWILPLLHLVSSALGGALASLDLAGCSGGGAGKLCKLKPVNCDPLLDCTLALVLYTSAPNWLHAQLMAQTLMPPKALQYIAVAFSNDQLMGDDMVVECVLSTDGSFIEPEMFISYNSGKANDRTYLQEWERQLLFENVTGEIADGRLYCEFNIQLVPQFAINSRPIWHLNQSFYIFGATGSAQPDELNAHDTSGDSFFYPIISAERHTPSMMGTFSSELPLSFSFNQSNRTEKTNQKKTAAAAEESVRTGTQLGVTTSCWTPTSILLLAITVMASIFLSFM